METRILILRSDLRMPLGEESGHKWLSFGALQFALCGQPAISPNSN